MGAPDFRHQGPAPQGPVLRLILFLALSISLVFTGTLLAELNPDLFNPLTRIENACRRASNIMLTAPDPPRENEMVLRPPSF